MDDGGKSLLRDSEKQIVSFTLYRRFLEATNLTFTLTTQVNLKTQ
jgi:hypothetical protein